MRSLAYRLVVEQLGAVQLEDLMALFGILDCAMGELIEPHQHYDAQSNGQGASEDRS